MSEALSAHEYENLIVTNLEDERNLGIRHHLTALRDRETDRREFERHAELLAQTMFPYVSNDLPVIDQTVETPLDVEAEGLRFAQEDIVITPVLRAGLPMRNGLRRHLPYSQMYTLDAWREEDLDVTVNVDKGPRMTGKTVLLVDPMIATGNTMTSAYEALEENHEPDRYVVQAFFSVEEGLRQMDGYFPENTRVYTATIDPELNDHGYIVPGCGDAGDRALADTR